MKIIKFEFVPLPDMCARWAKQNTVAQLANEIPGNILPLSTRNCSCCAFKESISYCWSERILSSLFWSVFGTLDSSEASNSCKRSAAIFLDYEQAQCAIWICQCYWSIMGVVFLSSKFLHRADSATDNFIYNNFWLGRKEKCLYTTAVAYKPPTGLLQTKYHMFLELSMQISTIKFKLSYNNEDAI